MGQALDLSGGLANVCLTGLGTSYYDLVDGHHSLLHGYDGVG